jgi:hypothetical protein
MFHLQKGGNRISNILWINHTTGNVGCQQLS